jgi:hypothetical protein
MAKRYHSGKMMAHEAMMNRDVTGSERADLKHSMIHEDHSKPSNLPQEVMMKEYPSQDYYNSYIDDTMYGIDGQHNEGVRGMKKQIRQRMF